VPVEVFVSEISLHHLLLCMCVQGVGHMPIVSLCPHTPQLENSLDVQ
jgi:hypothetical protein